MNAVLFHSGGNILSAIQKQKNEVRPEGKRQDVNQTLLLKGCGVPDLSPPCRRETGCPLEFSHAENKNHTEKRRVVYFEYWEFLPIFSRLRTYAFIGRYKGQ